MAFTVFTRVPIQAANPLENILKMASSDKTSPEAQKPRHPPPTEPKISLVGGEGKIESDTPFMQDI